MARALSEVELSQNKFLMGGGSYELALMKKRKSGEIASDYVYNEYPKVIRVSHGTETVETEVETCNKGVFVRSVDVRPIFEDIIVSSEADEERVLSGGKTSVQIEEERLGLISRCHTMGVPCDPSWSAVRLRRLLGDALDAPAPGDSMAKLEAELANLRKIEALQAEIAELKGRQAARDVEPAIEEPGDTRRRKSA